MEFSSVWKVSWFLFTVADGRFVACLNMTFVYVSSFRPQTYSSMQLASTALAVYANDRPIIGFAPQNTGKNMEKIARRPVGQISGPESLKSKWPLSSDLISRRFLHCKHIFKKIHSPTSATPAAIWSLHTNCLIIDFETNSISAYP